MERVEKLNFIFLCLLIFCLPLPLATHREWAWSVMEVWVAIQTLLVVITGFTSFPWYRVKRFLWLLVPLCIFQLWVSLQLISLPPVLTSLVSPNSFKAYVSAGSQSYTISLDNYATSVGLIKGVAYTLFAFNSLLLIRNIERLKIVLYVVIASGTFQAFYGALEVLLHVKQSWFLRIPQGNRANGTFVYHNHLANYLMMVLCLGTGVIVSQLHHTSSGSWNVRLQRWFSAVLSPKMIIRLCLVIMVITLVMTRSRMGNTAFFLVTTFGGVIALIFYKNRPRALTVLIFSLLLIDTVIVGTVFGLEKVKSRLEMTSTATETRDQAVEWSIDYIKDFPYTGSGLGSFYDVFPSYTRYNIGYYNFAHNEYIQFAAEVGIPITIFMGGMIIYALWISLNAMRKRNSKTLRGTALGCLMAITGMLIHISVDFNLQAPANVMTFILILVLAGLTSSMNIRKGS